MQPGKYNHGSFLMDMVFGDQNFQWMVFHIILGILSIISNYVLIGWFYFVVIQIILKSGHLNKIIPIVLIYSLGIEIMGRMTKADPFIPYELGKYSQFIFLSIGIINLKRMNRGQVGWIILFLSIPALFEVSGDRIFGNIVFNYFGILNLSLAIIYFSHIKWHFEEFLRYLKLVIFPSLTVLVYAVIKSPDILDIKYTLGAIDDVSGGFGSNQVATIYGLAFGCLILMWLYRVKFSGNSKIDLGLAFLFLFWGLITLSRGGVIAPILSLLMILLMTGLRDKKHERRKVNMKVIFSILLLLGGGFFLVNKITSNALFLRYQGQTPGTMTGRQTVNLDAFTSGRSTIFLSDLEIWRNNFVFGVGPGESAKARKNLGFKYIIAHIEISRLLSEHGLLGFFITLLLIFTPIAKYLNTTKTSYRVLFIFCFTMALATTMHSAMRTGVSPLFFGLGFITLTGDFSNPLNRKRINTT